MQDLFQLSFFKKNGQKATVQIGAYSSWDALDTVRTLFKDDYFETAEFPERIESSNTESN